VREAVSSGDMRKLRKAGQRNKKNEANDIVITDVSDEAFVNFKTFVPVSGNIFGKDIAHGKAVHLTVENEKFIKKLMLDQDVRKNAVVNHIIDVVRIYFKK
jgi:pentose-5-phosphate-3-epimerase